MTKEKTPTREPIGVTAKVYITSLNLNFGWNSIRYKIWRNVKGVLMMKKESPH
jgi:hypothetical protein